MACVKRTMMLALALVGACHAPAEKQEELEQRPEAFIGGVPSGPEQNFAPLIKVPGNFPGTGVLVAPNLILTALHIVAQYGAFTESYCIPGGSGVDIFGVYPKENFSVYLGPKIPPTDQAPTVAVKKVIPYPSVNLCDGDLAFLLMESDLDAPTVPIRLDSPAVVGEDSFGVGWGVYDPDGSLPKQRQMFEGIKVLALGPGEYKSPGGLIVHGMTQGHLISSGTGCKGDSGSGLYAKSSGAVLGIQSTKQNDDPSAKDTADQPYFTCTTSVVFYVRLDRYKDFVMKAFKEAGHSPWLEGKPKPAPLDAACTQNAECDSGGCVEGRCAKPCTTEACPDTHTCVDLEGSKVCAPAGWAGAGGAAGAAGAGGSSGEGQGGGASGEGQGGGASGEGQGGGPGGDAGKGPQGSPCSEAAQCASGLCLTAQGSVCSGVCDAAPCEGGWECSSAGGRKVCLPPAKTEPGDDGCAVGERPSEGGLGWGLLAGAVLAARARRRR